MRTCIWICCAAGSRSTNAKWTCRRANSRWLKPSCAILARCSAASSSSPACGATTSTRDPMWWMCTCATCETSWARNASKPSAASATGLLPNGSKPVPDLAQRRIRNEAALQQAAPAVGRQVRIEQGNADAVLGHGDFADPQFGQGLVRGPAAVGRFGFDNDQVRAINLPVPVGILQFDVAGQPLTIDGVHEGRASVCTVQDRLQCRDFLPVFAAQHRLEEFQIRLGQFTGGIQILLDAVLHGGTAQPLGLDLEHRQSGIRIRPRTYLVPPAPPLAVG